MTNNLQLKLLTTEEVGTIYDKCLDFLSCKGIKVDHPQALKMLDKAGAQVDFDNQQVRFPKDIIAAALRSVPRSLTLATRNEHHDIIIPHPSGTFYAIGAGAARNYLDPESNTSRDMTLAYAVECAQLVEALDEIDACGPLPPRDVPEETTDIHGLKTTMENTSKHIRVQVYTFESVQYLFELAQVVAGSTEALQKRPIMTLGSSAFAPLTVKRVSAEAMIQACRYGVPHIIASLPSAGGTSPLTIAGTVLLSSIEILALLVMSQLIKPGNPVMAGSSSFTLDMATGHILGSSIEALLAKVAKVQFIRDAYHIPILTGSFLTDSAIPDGQAMIEKTLGGLLLISMTDINLLGGAGMLDAGNGLSPIQLVIDTTLIGILKRVISGVQVDDDTLAWKEILDTAPGGHFLERPHTLQHCREAIRPELFVRVPAEVWSLEGGKDLYTRAVEKYRELKKGLQPLPLPEEVQKELNRIVKHADERLAK